MKFKNLLFIKDFSSKMSNSSKMYRLPKLEDNQNYFVNFKILYNKLNPNETIPITWEWNFTDESFIESTNKFFLFYVLSLFTNIEQISDSAVRKIVQLIEPSLEKIRNNIQQNKDFTHPFFSNSKNSEIFFDKYSITEQEKYKIKKVLDPLYFQSVLSYMEIVQDETYKQISDKIGQIEKNLISQMETPPTFDILFTILEQCLVTHFLRDLFSSDKDLKIVETADVVRNFEKIVQSKQREYSN